ncbi:MAG: SpoIID/LytB domain-containing protein [Candidatus Omnitrophica bacterium]|nr:SpoIID/LytB domain-containing protein [Candidatus Omnitrophota bacterium]
MLKFTLKKNLVISIFLTLIWIGFSQNELYVKFLDGNVFKKVELENYIAGVVSKEMGEKWPEESLKAQAVVSRTYLIWKMQTKKNSFYDIENSIYHQVFEDCKSEKIKKLVNETRGEIIVTHDEKIVPVFFHACSGGYTANPSDVWGGIYPYNISIVDYYCKDSPYLRWKKTLTKKYLSEILGIQIKKLEVIERDKSGRIKILHIIDKNDKINELSGHKFRLKVNEKTKVSFNNPYIIPSTMFEIEDIGNAIIFKGQGYGHGVGLCQYGAKKMAEEGFNYREILKFYFPNFIVKNLSEF